MTSLIFPVALVKKYATRLHLTRAALLERLTPENPALPPDVSELLPSGPVSLEKGEVELEGDDGELESIDFDELPVVKGADVPTLLRQARADWGALS